MIRRPQNHTSGERYDPLSLTIELTQAPLSSASMELPDDSTIAIGDLVELFTPHGSAGLFRANRLEHSFGSSINVELQHALCTLSDVLIKKDDEEHDGTAREALEMILAPQELWQLGDVDVPDDETLHWEIDYSNVLESLCNIMDELKGYMLVTDFTTTPWTLHIKALQDDDACECRLNRNLSSLSVDYDRAELCTRLYVRDIEGLEDPLDADTLPLWGVVERTMSFDEGTPKEDAEKAALAYLDEHKNPLISVMIDGVELAQITGESIDRFHLGRLCRVCLPDYGQTIRHRVVSIRYNDLIADEYEVRVTLSNEVSDTADAIAGIMVDNTILKNRLYEQAQHLTVVAETIRLQAQMIALKADLILLDGYVKADQLETETLRVLQSARVPDLKALNFGCSGEANINHLNATEAIIGNLAAGGLVLEGSKVGWSSQYVLTGQPTLTVSKNTKQVMLADGTSGTIDYVTGVTVTIPSQTLSYLGASAAE